MTLETLELSAWPYNALTRWGIETVEDLLALDYWEILKVKNLGCKGRAEVFEKLEALGYDCYHLKEDSIK